MISSCCRNVKFYDVLEMSIESSNTFIASDEDLYLTLSATEIEFVGSTLNDFSFASALAVTCDEGWGGMKYPFTNVTITSNADFNPDLPANSDLANLFDIKKFLEDGAFEYLPLAEVQSEAIETDNMELLLSARPTTDSIHQFTITLLKSNEEMIVLETEEIVWD